MNTKKKAGLLQELKESIPAYILILPTIAILIIFLFIPFANAFRISLYKYKGYGELRNYVGLDNYIKVLQDEQFYRAFGNTFKLIACDLLISITIGFILAYILFKGIRLKRFFNTALFIPYLISMVVIGCIWRIIYDPTIGPLNQILEMIGLGGLAQPWLSQVGTALPAIIVTWIWRTIPFNMLICYANIMTLPKDQLEAAEMDGASQLQRLRYIIIPHMIPTFITLGILTVTNDLRAFDMVWVMTQGGPGGASDVLTSYVYSNAFQSQKFGPATAASIIMMVVMISITIILQLVKKAGGKNRE
ncbi:carbohydrate ABC transporter permease [Mediterraneibacter sp. ICN-202921]|uniref:carbohydrate ABC transporter permease n=1 Tax=Mediterraneibacter sp. ICN-202921 TaxID=3134657 RepID=UPI000E47DCB4|nr:sugar ABC transporter permease [Ruminococcus sp. AF18-22]